MNYSNPIASQNYFKPITTRSQTINNLADNNNPFQQHGQASNPFQNNFRNPPFPQGQSYTNMFPIIGSNKAHYEVSKSNYLPGFNNFSTSMFSMEKYKDQNNF